MMLDRNYCLALVLFAGASQAWSTDLQSAVGDCANIRNDVDRLACYDKLATPPPALPKPAPETSPESSPESSPAADRDTDDQPVHVAAAPEPDFGLAEKPPVDDEPKEVVARVTDIDRQPHGEHIVLLDNGQVWVEETASRYFGVDVGDTVTIRKRLFAGYRLVSPAGKGYEVERIR